MSHHTHITFLTLSVSHQVAFLSLNPLGKNKTKLNWAELSKRKRMKSNFFRTYSLWMLISLCSKGNLIWWLRPNMLQWFNNIMATIQWLTTKKWGTYCSLLHCIAPGSPGAYQNSKASNSLTTGLQECTIGT